MYITYKKEYLDWDTIVAMVRNLQNETDYLFSLYICLSSCWCLNIRTALALKYSDIFSRDLKIKRIVHLHEVFSNGKRIRKVLVNRSVENIIYDTVSKFDFSVDYLDHYIFSGKSGKPMSKQYINRKIKSFDRYIIDVDITSNTFRKSFCMKFLQEYNSSDTSIELLQYVLNHSTKKVTLDFLNLKKLDSSNEDVSIYNVFEL
jgi:integrase